MNTIVKILRIIIAVFFIILQQALIVGIGLLVYDNGGLLYAILVWMLCLPMLYINYHTWKYVNKYGLITFITANADTSEIDVDPEKRPYT